jgi:hypothetical protein
MMLPKWYIEFVATKHCRGRLKTHTQPFRKIDRAAPGRSIKRIITKANQYFS